MSAARPALADVLGVLTSRGAERWRDVLGHRDCRVTIDDHAAMSREFFDHRDHDFEFRWRHADPAAALEALATATPALVPAHWVGAPRAPRWWCEACGGDGLSRSRGGVVLPSLCVGCCELHADGGWTRFGDTAAPRSLPALVAVGSLGVGALARAEAIVAEAWPGSRLIWRTMANDALTHHAYDRYSTAAARWHREPTADPSELFGVEAWRASLRRPGDRAEFWPPQLPYTPGNVTAEVAASWPALCAMAALGIDLAACSGGRVVLAIEVLP